MSFLAGLRTQQSATHQSLRLCYLLEINRHNADIRLSLVLTEIEQEHPVPPGVPYIIRPDHLRSPPSFLDTGDLLILQQLINDRSSWLDESTGSLPDNPEGQFIANLLSTGRCYLKSGKGSWQQLTGSTSGSELMSVLVQPCWVVDEWGNQKFSWQHPLGSVVFFYHGLYLMWEDTGMVATGQCQLSAAAIAEALTDDFSLDYQQAGVFREHRGRQWQLLGLPLPMEPVVVEDEVQVFPVLHLTSSSADCRTNSADRLGLLFRYSSSGLCAVFHASASDEEINYWDGERLHRLRRQPVVEQHWYGLLQEHLSPSWQCGQTGNWWVHNAEDWRHLLLESRSILEDAGFCFQIDRGFQQLYLRPGDWRIRLQAGADDQWRFSVSIQAGGTDIDLMKLLNKLQDRPLLGEAYQVNLPAGGKLQMSAKQLSGLREELGDLLGLSYGGCLPASQLGRLTDLEALLPEEVVWDGDLELLDRARVIQQPPRFNLAGPVLFGAELRAYQQTGVCWLQHLRQQGVNGLLADDMGLGKTLQTIAHLYLEKQQGLLTQPALIVVPTSLMDNWMAEIRRFAPELSCLIQHGEKRHHVWRELKHYDVLITSYSLAARDLQHWQQQSLSWVILDEAQMIKNPRTKISQAVKGLQCAHRLCLTGTPVQNHLGELWSIFDFLLPGCLGNEQDFRRYYRKPIEQEGNETRFQQLLRRIAPFMLRRTKDQVATDLPPKTEIIQHVGMAEDQQDFYQQLRHAELADIERKFAGTKIEGQQHIQVLAALMKLRQACCDPALLGEPGISSAKREQCLEMVEELVSEGRAVLVFSQFTSMLDLLAKELIARSIDYLMLTGKSTNRGALIDAFQRGGAQVFLISLKAGGVGLNLTRADTVIHYDPWWNSAAEQQASDRAHRIGQEKPVFVYKLIIKDSVEGKIARIQSHKEVLGGYVGEQARRSGEQFALGLQELLALMEDDEEKTNVAAFHS